MSSGLTARLWERHPWGHCERPLLVKNATHEQVGLALQGAGEADRPTLTFCTATPGQVSGSVSSSVKWD